MEKPTICICENKGADQLRGNREADQRLCFRYSDSTIPLLLKSEISSFYCFLCLYRPVCVGPVRKPHCWFSHEAAHIYIYIYDEIHLSGQYLIFLIRKGPDTSGVIQNMKTHVRLPSNIYIEFYHSR